MHANVMALLMQRESIGLQRHVHLADLVSMFKQSEPATWPTIQKRKLSAALHEDTSHDLCSIMTTSPVANTYVNPHKRDFMMSSALSVCR